MSTTFTSSPPSSKRVALAANSSAISRSSAELSAAEDRLIAELFAANATRFLDGDELVNALDTVDFY